MSYLDALSYKGKRVVVTGAASGMGDATVRILAELGAETYGLDVKPVQGPVAKYLQTDLGDRASIDRAVAQISGQVDAVFNIAGLPGRPFSNLQTAVVNYVGHRHLTESLLSRMPRGGAIASVATLSYTYMSALETLKPLVTALDFDAAKAWLEQNEGKNNGYGTSKQALCLWTVLKAKEYAERYGVRINVVGPASTETPLLPQFMANAGEERVRFMRGFLGRYGKPEDMAWALVFLNSGAASFISGQVLFVDAAMGSAIQTGQVQVAAPPAPR